MSKNQQYHEFCVKAFEFIAGELSAQPESEKFDLLRFIDARSRIAELREMREFHAVVNSRFSKRQYIQFFCDLCPFERKKLCKELPSMIIALPADCKTLKIKRPQKVAFRSGNFGGKTIEYEVYGVLDILKSLNAIADCGEELE